MKKILSIALCFALLATFAAGAAEFTPAQNVTFVVSSSPGGGSDAFARTITNIIVSEKLADINFIVNNLTDGNGEVSRLTVATAGGRLANHTLLSMNSGDCGDMLDNTSNRIENFTPIATMAVDKQLLMITPEGKYKSFKEILDALAAGTPVVMSGSKGSDTTTVEALLEEIGYDMSQKKYIAYDSTGDAITAILGNHVDVVIVKPGSAIEYAEAKSLIPVLALSDKRFSDVPVLADAPTLNEVDSKYKNVERPIWRSVVAPGSMSPAAAKYWGDLMQKVTETKAWAEYIEKNSLLRDYRSLADTKAYITAFEEQYLAAQE
ncbi:MAG: tripartite tricarboxylate transporter substrate binding protein [Candidatus Adiutrix sp.]|jgi:putative tricarboxylic transport membrane protein|nr:tripartite tricarboxylate transporter substrate binding protein [Candidatus Adiutrix sp.]